jgi:hypothetical protein
MSRISWRMRIHCEAAKLGFDIGLTTVAKYMTRRRRPLQGLKAFPCNHAGDVASIVCLSSPRFHLDYDGFLVVRHSRPDLLWEV